jgi:perosamine synthetase
MSIQPLRAHAAVVPAEREPRRAGRKEFLPFAVPTLGDEEVAAVVDVLRSGWLTTGPRAEAFEAEFAAYISCRHALAVQSGTAALHVALEAVGVSPKDEVITTPMTFTATAAVIEHLGARPVFVDCEPDTLNLDAERLEQSITRRTRAILPVHFAGQSCDMNRIMEIARHRNLAVVEDAAHALPTSCQRRRIGTIGDVTCFSFYVTKSITTGEGGMATTQRDDLADRMRMMRLHGMSRDAWKRYRADGSWTYDVLAAGYKYNFTDMAAAIGSVQLRRCDEFHARRQAIARRYTAAFRGLPGLDVPPPSPHGIHAWHLYVMQVDGSALRIDRDGFLRELRARNIGASLHFIPLHQLSHYRQKYGFQALELPNATSAAARVFSLPIYPRMTDRDVEDVVDAVTSIAKEYRR